MRFTPKRSKPHTADKSDHFVKSYKNQICAVTVGPHRLTFTRWGCYSLRPSPKPTKLAHSFYSVLVSISVFIVLSTVFHSINSPDNSPFSDSVLPVLSLPYWSFQLYISL